MLSHTPPGHLRSALSAACTPVLLAAALCCWPLTAARAQAPADRTTLDIEAGVDPSITPGDDFFAYANGGWLKATEIPAGKDRWSARSEIDARTQRQIVALLDDAATAPKGTLARKVGDFRAAYLNVAAIERRGLAPLRPLLDSIERVEDKAALTRLLGRELGADVDPLNWGIYRSSHLIGLSVEPGLHGEKTYVAFLLQGGLGLPDRENYVSTDPAMQALKASYGEYIGHLLALAGFDHAAQRARAVLALETALATSQATREASANDRNVDHLWTRADFARDAPGMDWSAFFTAAGLAGQESFVAWQPTALTGVATLVASQPLHTWKDYLRVRVLDEFADVLPAPFPEQALAVHGAGASSQPQGSSRAERALEATQTAMSGPLGRLYAERHFSAGQKARVQAIVANVIAAFRQRVEAVTWMSPATRAVALAKLKTIYFGIGYPEVWPDYSDLMVDSEDAVGNLRRVADRNYRQAVALLGRPVDMTEWWIAPQRVAAVLVFQQNAYNFPAALLQVPKFDSTASDAASYGAIGAIVGHEVSHFVDLLGAEYDPSGQLRHWWTAEDLARFQTAVEPLVNQFSGYHPFPDMSIDGKLTQTENIADLAGLSAAFDAYRRTLGDRATDREYVRQQDRQFFIGFARSWRVRIREDALRKQVATSDHAPESYRISTVRNLDAWYDAFDVQPGDRLYLEPGARVRIW